MELKYWLSAETFILVLTLSFYLFFAGTWIANVVRLANCDFKAPYRGEIFHAVGVVSPICLVTAFLDLD